MTGEEVLLAVLGPMLASIIERFNPINLKSLELRVTPDLAEFGSSDVLRMTVANIAAAAVEVSGVAPTFVAGITAGFAILHDDPAWWLIVYCIAFTLVLVGVVRLASSRSYLDLASMPAFPDLATRSLGKLRWVQDARGVEVLAWTIYLINVLVIVAALSTYAVGASRDAYALKKEYGFSHDREARSERSMKTDHASASVR